METNKIFILAIIGLLFSCILTKYFYGEKNIIKKIGLLTCQNPDFKNRKIKN